MKIKRILGAMLSKIEISCDPRSLNVLLEGDPSSGKTYLTESFAREMGVPFVSISCPTIQVEQVGGIPYREGGSVYFSRPAWIDELGENGILLLDEFNAADDDIQKAFLSLLSDRRINGHHLGSRVLIVAAQNDFRQAGNYKMSPAVAGRFAKYSVSFDYDDWRANYLPNRISSYALALIDDFRKAGFSFSSGQDFLKDGPWTTARSVERWLLGATSPDVLAFLMEDAYANLAAPECVVVAKVINSLKDKDSRANTIFERKEAADVDIRVSGKKKGTINDVFQIWQPK